MSSLADENTIDRCNVSIWGVGGGRTMEGGGRGASIVRRWKHGQLDISLAFPPFMHEVTTWSPSSRGSGSRCVKISNGPNTNSECSNLLN